MTIHILKKVDDLTAENSRFKLQGITGTAATNTTTNIDWQFPQERWINGGVLFVKNAHWNDKVSIQILANDQSTVVYEFATDFYMAGDESKQLSLEVPYVSLVPQNFYIRLKYTNTDLITASYPYLNLFTHIPADI